MRGRARTEVLVVGLFVAVGLALGNPPSGTIGDEPHPERTAAGHGAVTPLERGLLAVDAAPGDVDPVRLVARTRNLAGGVDGAIPRPAPMPWRAGEADPRLRRTARPEGAAANPTLVVAPGTSDVAGAGPRLRFLVEVQKEVDVEPARFAAAVEQILFDPRSWTAGGRYSLQRVDTPPVDFRVTLAEPDVVDALCLPLETNGIYSCWNEERTMLNSWRWRVGADTYRGDLANYRRYLVNHEVGHALGRGHVDCAGPGKPAPVMMQQTISLGGCAPSPWPFPDAGR